MLVIAVFGEAPEFVRLFSATLGLSFAVAGGGLCAIALTQRRYRRPDPFMTNT
jgi:hypothetical protein